MSGFLAGAAAALNKGFEAEREQRHKLEQIDLETSRREQSALRVAQIKAGAKAKSETAFHGFTVPKEIGSPELYTKIQEWNGLNDSPRFKLGPTMALDIMQAAWDKGITGAAFHNLAIDVLNQSDIGTKSILDNTNAFKVIELPFQNVWSSHKGKKGLSPKFVNAIETAHNAMLKRRMRVEEVDLRIRGGGVEAGPDHVRISYYDGLRDSGLNLENNPDIYREFEKRVHAANDLEFKSNLRTVGSGAAELVGQHYTEKQKTEIYNTIAEKETAIEAFGNSIKALNAFTGKKTPDTSVSVVAGYLAKTTLEVASFTAELSRFFNVEPIALTPNQIETIKNYTERERTNFISALQLAQMAGIGSGRSLSDKDLQLVMAMTSLGTVNQQKEFLANYMGKLQTDIDKEKLLLRANKRLANVINNTYARNKLFLHKMHTNTFLKQMNIREIPIEKRKPRSGGSGGGGPTQRVIIKDAGKLN